MTVWTRYDFLHWLRAVMGLSVECDRSALPPETTFVTSCEQCGHQAHTFKASDSWIEDTDPFEIAEIVRPLLFRDACDHIRVAAMSSLGRLTARRP